MAKLLYFLVEHFGSTKTLEFTRSVSTYFSTLSYSSYFFQVSQVASLEDALSPTVDWTVVKHEFTQLLKDNEPLEDGMETDFEAVITEATTLTHFSIDKLNLYARRLSTDLSSAPQGHAFVNGKHFDLDDVGFCTHKDDASYFLVSPGIPAAHADRNRATDAIHSRTGDVILDLLVPPLLIQIALLGLHGEARGCRHFDSLL